MALNAPLTVRVSDGRTDRHVTRYASGLSFTKVAPGGHQSCQFHLNLPDGTFTDLGPDDKCWIYDGRTGRTIFGAGYLENPTPVDGFGGQSYDITAMGGMALANDESRPLIYVDQDLGKWDKDPYAAEAATVDAGLWVDDGTSQRLRVSIPGGGYLITGAFAGADCREFLNAGMNLGALTAFVKSGKPDVGYKVTFDEPSSSVALTNPMSTTGAGFSLYVGDDFTDPTDYVSLRLTRIGGPTNIGDDTTWTDFVNLIVAGQRMDRHGSLVSGASGMVSASQVLASQVVEDLLGRLLTMCDPATAQVDTTSFGIDQLAYPDGAKAADVLTDLANYEPDYWWGIHESGANGLHRFGYQQWATEPRYVVSVKDGWRQTGSDVDLCNRIVVYYTDPQGKQQHVTVTAADLGLVGVGLPVDALGSRVKDAEPFTLPQGRGSAATAAQVGASILRDKINPPLAGTVTVRRKILDLLTGNVVAPWELEPGWPVLVREKRQTIRCTQMSYDDQPVAATLTLGNPSPTDQQRLARLERRAA